MAYASRKIKERSTEIEMITLSDWFHHHYGQYTGYVAGVIVVIGLLGWLTGVFVATGLVMSSLFGVDYNLIIGCVVLIVVPMLLKGGYASLTRFDVVQFFIVSTGLICIYSLGFRDDAPIHFPSVSTVGSLGVIGTVSLFITVFSGVFAGGDVWQRMYATKNDREVIKGFGWACVLFTVAIIAIGGLGMISKESGFVGSENDVFAYVIENMLNPVVLPILLIVFLAAATSTINMIIFGGSSSLAKDFKRKGLTENVLFKRLRIIMVVVTLVCAGLSLLTQNVMGIAMAVMSSTTCFVSLLLINLFTSIRVSHITAFVSVLMALIVYLFLSLTGRMMPEFSGLPMVINLAVIVCMEPLVRIMSRSEQLES